jgi:signal transduction histidine kinase
LHGPSGDIETVLDNLLRNAIQYTPDGGKVDLALYPQDNCVVVEVSDSGPGIPAAERERIFDRFYRIPGAATGGTGLGLAIVKTICDRNAARISVAAGDGGLGARFRIEWPQPSA